MNKNRLQAWESWLEMKASIFGAWCARNGRTGTIIFYLIHYGGLVLIYAISGIFTYFGLWLSGLPVRSAFILTCVMLCAGTVLGIILRRLYPHKEQHPHCTSCGLLATHLCWKGPCAPGSWYCTYHYIRLHVPPEVQDALLQYVSDEEVS